MEQHSRSFDSSIKSGEKCMGTVMRYTFLILLLCTVLCFSLINAQDTSPTPGDDGVGDAYFPQLGNGGYDVQHYTIDLDVDMDQNMISGTVTIDLIPTQTLSAFNLDFDGYIIETVTIDEAFAPYERAGRELTITPLQPLAMGEAVAVSITYQGSPGGRGRGFSGGWVRYDNGVFVASEPAGAANWFPSNDHPLDKATFTFIITVPVPYVVAANGFLKDTFTDDAADTTTYVWQIEHLMASYLATVNIAEFAVETDTAPTGLPIRNYFPADLAEEGEEVFGDTGEMIAYFEGVFGPYPFDVYGVIVADVNLGFALETQTISLFGNNVLRTSTWGSARNNTNVQEVIAHELAHQWFGNSVSLSRWQDIWLNEGFASYAQILWVAHTQGEDAAEDKLRNWYAVISNPLNALNGLTPPGQPAANNLFNGGVYLRGGWTVHALRLKVGDDAFFNILRTYTDRYRYANATTADFVALAEEVSGMELDALFDGWLYDSVVPDVPEMGLTAPKDVPKDLD